MAHATLPKPVSSIYRPVISRFLKAMERGGRVPSPELSSVAYPRKRAALLLDLVEGVTQDTPLAFQGVCNASKQLFLYRLLLETERLEQSIKSHNFRTAEAASTMALAHLWLLEEQLTNRAQDLGNGTDDKRTWWYRFAVEENIPRIERLESRRPLME